VASRIQRRYKSKSERDLETVAKLCPNFGIRSIERGSQTYSESVPFGFSNIWLVFTVLNRSYVHFYPRMVETDSATLSIMNDTQRNNAQHDNTKHELV